MSPYADESVTGQKADLQHRKCMRKLSHLQYQPWLMTFLRYAIGTTLLRYEIWILQSVTHRQSMYLTGIWFAKSIGHKSMITIIFHTNVCEHPAMAHSLCGTLELAHCTFWMSFDCYSYSEKFARIAVICLHLEDLLHCMDSCSTAVLIHGTMSHQFCPDQVFPSMSTHNF